MFKQFLCVKSINQDNSAVPLSELLKFCNILLVQADMLFHSQVVHFATNGMPSRNLGDNLIVINSSTQHKDQVEDNSRTGIIGGSFSHFPR